MDNSELSLTHFGHLFEVFGTYYLLLGTSKRFHDYFGISQIFKTWPGEYEKFRVQSEKVEELHTEWRDRTSHTPPPPITKLKQHHRQEEKRAKKLLTAMNTLVKIKNCNKKIERDVRLHFPEVVTSNPGLDEPSIFYKFMRPFYIYFGTLAISLLVLGGIYDHWDSLDKLSTINFVSFIILSILLVLILSKNKWMVNTTWAFLLSISFLLIFVAFPTSLTSAISFIPYIPLFPSDHAAMSNCAILTSVTAIVLPILIHIVVLVFILIRYGHLKRLQNKLNTYISTPFAIPVAPTDIPEAPDDPS